MKMIGNDILVFFSMGFEYITALCDCMKTFIEGLLHLSLLFGENSKRERVFPNKSCERRKSRVWVELDQGSLVSTPLMFWAGESCLFQGLPWAL